MAYESRREAFDKIAKKYFEYVKLYRLVNGGSVEDITPFEEFYWRFTYLHRYEDPSKVGTGNR